MCFTRKRGQIIHLLSVFKSFIEPNRYWTFKKKLKII